MNSKISLTALLLATLAPSAAAQISGEVLYRVYGRPHAELEKARFIDDINGDGHLEFLVGSPYAPQAGSVGYCAVISGADGIVLREHYGNGSTSWLGQDFTCLHDLNSDGVKEYAVSAPGEFDGADQGCVYIYDGATGAQLRELRDVLVTARMGDFVLGGTDFTGDAIPDLCVMAANQTVVKIYSGANLLTALSPAKVVPWSAGEIGDWGQKRPFNPIADLDGDGVAELGMVSGDWQISSSRCRIYSTMTGAELFSGASHPSHNSSVMSIGDLNGDGTEEFIVGSGTAGGYDQAQGVLECFDGATMTVLWDYYVGPSGYPDGVGGCMVLIDDVDGDGYRDFATGKGNSGNSFLGSGVEIFSSLTGTPIKHFDTPLSSYSTWDDFGACLEAGDLDGDGQLELIVGQSKVHHKYGGFLDKFTGVVLVADLDF